MDEAVLQAPLETFSTTKDTQNYDQILDQQKSQITRGTTINELNLKIFYKHDCRLAQADAFRRAKQNLLEALQSIQKGLHTQNRRYHTGQLDCHSCDAKNKRIVEAYKNYFLSDDPDAWHADISEYEVMMRTRFQGIKNLSKADVRELLSSYRDMLRNYIFDLISEFKLENDEQFFHTLSESLATDVSYEQTIQKINNVFLLYFADPDVKRLLLGLQKSNTAAERASLYVQYYCAVGIGDTPQQRNFKAKYARMFENYLTHDEVLSAMKKEAQDLNVQRINSLRKELCELQLAQSAHLKNKARKAEKDQRMRDRKLNQKLICCSLRNCEVELNPAEENLECALCEWLHRKEGSKRRFFYCSIEHAEEDFEYHDSHEHVCVTGDRCFYNAQAGLPSETAAAGICSSCLQNNGSIFYFCSAECYNYNIDWHVNRYHIFDSLREDINMFEQFRCSPNLRIVS